MGILAVPCSSAKELLNRLDSKRLARRIDLRQLSLDPAPATRFVTAAETYHSG
jgi:hypothetical protein